MRINNPPKKHHYVPQFILKNFSHEGKIFTYEKPTGYVRKLPVKKVFQEENFYKIGNSVELESVLGKIEHRASLLIKEIITSNTVGWLDASEKRLLLEFFALQTTRTPVFRKNQMMMLRHLLEKSVDTLWANGALPESELIRKIMKKAGGTKLTDLLNVEVWDSDFVRVQQALVMGNIPLGLEKHKVFTLFVSDADDFYISDQAAVMFNTRDLGPYGNIGFAVPGVEMYLPLSSNCVLAILDENWRGFYGNLGFVHANKDCVEALNRIQVCWADKFVASKSGNFSRLKQVLKESPATQHGSIYRIRFS